MQTHYDVEVETGHDLFKIFMLVLSYVVDGPHVAFFILFASKSNRFPTNVSFSCFYWYFYASNVPAVDIVASVLAFGFQMVWLNVAKFSFKRLDHFVRTF